MSLVVAALAQQPAPADVTADRLAFTIEFEDGRISPQPVGAIRGRSWTPMFPRVVPWQPRPGEPALDAIQHSFERTADGVRFKTSVLLGKPHQREVVVHEGTLRVGERATVDGVLAYGARPVVVGLIRMGAPAYHEPTLVSAAPSLVITDVSVETTPAPRYLVTVENLKDRAVKSLSVESRHNGKRANTGIEGDEEGRALIAPRSRYTFDFPFPTGWEPRSDGWAPPPAEGITITAVIWDDGTFEGSERPAAVHALQILGRRTQLERLVPLLTRARAEVDLSRVMPALRRQIEALPIDVDPALQQSARTLRPASAELPADEATALLRHVLQRTKTLATRALEDVDAPLAAGNIPAARKALERVHDRFASWLARLNATP